MTVTDNAMSAERKPMPNIDAFQAHLDVCPRCEQRPFDLCPVGAVLLPKILQDVFPERNAIGKAKEE